MRVVMDASALLAFLHGEPGDAAVISRLEGALVSAVNWSEVLQKSLRLGVDVEGMEEEFQDMGITFEAFTPAQAQTAARLWEAVPKAGLSLADRACLALALESGLPVMTADRAWRHLSLGLDIQLIR